MNVNSDDMKKWREGMGLTRDELARELKTTYTTVYRWEKGEREIPPYLELALETIERNLKKNLVHNQPFN